MTVFGHEMRRSRWMLLIWSTIVGGMILICMLMFPEMQGQMDGVSDLFASMGGFTEAFGMDRLHFGTVMGFYGIECGNILGIGGAFFAAFIGARMLSKEEAEHTAEFLLTHPVRRSSVVGEKLAALTTQLLLFHLICVGCSLFSFAIISERPVWDAFWLFHLAQFLLHVEIACICFGVSAFVRRGGLGCGLGLAALLYFLNIFGNISEKASFVRYITPFAYAEAADILPSVSIDAPLAALGLLYAAAGTAAAFLWYGKKDIAA